MSFLGGVDLGDPAERARASFTKDFELQRSRWQPLDDDPFVYRGGFDLVLKHGEFYMGRKLPDQYAHLFGVESACFFNALEAVQADPTLKYCEGWATTGYGEPNHHAWAIAPDGGVLDLTWHTDIEWSPYAAPGITTLPPDRWSYYGVILHPDLVQELLDLTGELGFFGRSGAEDQTWRRIGMSEEAGHCGDPRILKVPYDPGRRSLA